MQRRLTIAACLALLLAAQPSRADEVADFYSRNPIRLLIGTAAGGGSDATARLIAEGFSKHLPGRPAVVPQNMPGAGSMTMMSYLFAAAPQDGTVIGFGLPGVVEAQLYYPETARYDGRRLNWIGTPDRGTAIVSVLKPAPAETLEAARSTELIIGTTGPGSASYQMPRIAANLLGLKFKLVTGFPGSNQINLAMERGEVHGSTVGTSSWINQRPDWVRDNRLAHIIQIGPKDMRRHPDVPALSELVDPRQKQLLALLEAGPAIGWPLAMGPGVPAARVAAVRKAFEDMMRDGAFLAEMKARLKIEPDPAFAERLTAGVAAVLASPPELVAEAKRILEIK